MDSELLLKFIEYFPDCLSALSRTLLHSFGQPLSKQLYMTHAVVVSSLLSSLRVVTTVTALGQTGITYLIKIHSHDHTKVSKLNRQQRGLYWKH